MNPSSAPTEIAARVRETSPAIVLSARGNAGKIPSLGVPESFGRGDDGVPEFAPFRALLDSLSYLIPPFFVLLIHIWITKMFCFTGYLNIEDACLSMDGWLRTGDIAYFDSDGYLYIVGRLKEVIKYKGFQVAPADLEAVLIEHPENLDVAVTSADDEEAGEIPVAFVVRKAGSSLSCTQVVEYVANQVSTYKKVRKVVFVESIPKSAAGKVLRSLLKDSLRDDVASTECNSSSRSRL